MKSDLIVRIMLGMALSIGAGCGVEGPTSEDSLDSPDEAAGKEGGQRESPDATRPAKLNVSAASDSTFAGSFVDQAGTEVRFTVSTSSETTFHLAAYVGEAHLEVEADAQSRSLYSNGHHSVLTQADRQALAAASEALRRELGDELGVMGSFAEHLVVQNFGFWSESPDGHVLGERVFDPSQKGTGNDGITCVSKGSWRQVGFDQGNGGSQSWYSAQVDSNWGTNNCGGGDYSCMGRCGAGCGWGAPSSYTLDCLEHDACSHDLCASGGGSDYHCGDEFNEAQDDWTWGVSNGCWG